MLQQNVVRFGMWIFVIENNFYFHPYGKLINICNNVLAKGMLFFHNNFPFYELNYMKYIRIKLRSIWQIN